MTPDSLPSSGTRLVEILAAMVHSALVWEEEHLPAEAPYIDRTLHRSQPSVSLLLGGITNGADELDEKQS